jgi:Predicted membrane protein
MIKSDDLILFFTIYSFLGWVLETAFASITAKKFVNRGFLKGPICPIYGFGAVLVIQLSKLLSNAFENHFALLFLNILFSIILVTILEYITGLFLEKIFQCKWWDYSDNSFNLHGYICLKYSLLWGLLAFLLIQLMHPIISQVIFIFPDIYKDVLTAFFFICLFTDTVNSIIETIDLRKVILNYSNISINKYYEKIIKYKRFFLAFPKLLILNTGIINRDIKSILNDSMHKIKIKIRIKIF